MGSYGQSWGGYPPGPSNRAKTAVFTSKTPPWGTPLGGGYSPVLGGTPQIRPKQTPGAPPGPPLGDPQGQDKNGQKRPKKVPFNNSPIRDKIGHFLPVFCPFLGRFLANFGQF